MAFGKEDLDLVLVPSGLLIMFLYHIILLYRYIHLPHTTAIGFENNDKRAWVERIMQDDKRDIGTVLSVISSNISAVTFLCSVSLSLSSLIGTWLGSSSSHEVFTSELIYGNVNPSILTIKYISLLTCLLLAFACFVHSARHFVHANYLISTPDSNIPASYVELAVIRGGDFWSLGLRALCFCGFLVQYQCLCPPWFWSYSSITWAQTPDLFMTTSFREGSWLKRLVRESQRWL
ncbi:unnamed protein product [Prunus armeniaca]|uniref:Uncharacterized protein n=1 Tax=Prunus armeniaca TaxID=36596 RepID=A0A6J5USC7_PRUAR|nr:unnamed protein product [Prunus armeniaca]